MLRSVEERCGGENVEEVWSGGEDVGRCGGEDKGEFRCGGEC